VKTLAGTSADIQYTVWTPFKGIVSQDFGALFLISLDRFEGHYRAGSGLFLILTTFSCLNFIKLVLRGKDLLELMFLELLPIRKFFVLPHITAVWHKECAGKQNKIT
jgi:hypothetical protein